MPIRTKTVCIAAITGISGTCEISFKCPGTFSGLDPFASTPASGRFIKEVRLWSDALIVASRIYNMRVEDTDNVLIGTGKPFPNQAAAQAVFPDYPTIISFDDSVTESGGLLKGGFLPPNQQIVLIPIDPGRYDFMPSELYLKCSCDAGSTGKIFRMNLLMGKQEAV